MHDLPISLYESFPLLIIFFLVACLLANCERFFARCEITQAGLAQCVCPSFDSCPLMPDEVCANDTRTYDTECHMLAQACEQRTPLTVVKKGLCGKFAVRCSLENIKTLGYFCFKFSLISVSSLLTEDDWLKTSWSRSRQPK